MQIVCPYYFSCSIYYHAFSHKLLNPISDAQYTHYLPSTHRRWSGFVIVRSCIPFVAFPTGTTPVVVVVIVIVAGAEVDFMP